MAKGSYFWLGILELLYYHDALDNRDNENMK